MLSKTSRDSRSQHAENKRTLFVTLLATIAKQERIRISERTKAGLRTARRKGQTLGRPRVEVDVAKVRRMQEQGMGLRGIAEQTEWSLSSIMRALRAA